MGAMGALGFLGPALSNALAQFVEQRQGQQQQKFTNALALKKLSDSEDTAKRQYPTLLEKGAQAGSMPPTDLANLLQLESKQPSALTESEIAKNRAQAGLDQANANQVNFLAPSRKSQMESSAGANTALTNLRNRTNPGSEGAAKQDDSTRKLMLKETDSPADPSQVDADAQVFDKLPDATKQKLTNPGLIKADHEKYIQNMTELYKMAQKSGNPALAASVLHALRQRGPIFQGELEQTHTGAYDDLMGILNGNVKGSDDTEY